MRRKWARTAPRYFDVSSDRDWRKERALDGLRNHEIVLRKAAELADVTDVEMLSLAAEDGIDVGYTAEDLERI